MNLFDMTVRGDRNLVLRADVIGDAPPSGIRGRLASALGFQSKSRIARAMRHVDGREYRGLDMSGGASFQLRSPLSWHPFRALPHQTGWSAVLINGRTGGAVLQLALVDRESGERVAVERVTLSTHLSSLPLPKL